jgi:hypothetical protein
VSGQLQAPVALSLGKSPLYSFDVPQSRSGSCGKKEEIFDSVGNRTPALQSVTIPTELSYQNSPLRPHVVICNQAQGQLVSLFLSWRRGPLLVSETVGDFADGRHKVLLQSRSEDKAPRVPSSVSKYLRICTGIYLCWRGAKPLIPLNF